MFSIIIFLSYANFVTIKINIYVLKDNMIFCIFYLKIHVFDYFFWMLVSLY